MIKLGELADGTRGVALVELWKRINERCFAGPLSPLPVQWVTCMPYGACVGLTRGRHPTANGRQRSARIEIMRSKTNQQAALILLHETVHQYLMERKMDSSHISKVWREELVRLSLSVFGKRVIAPRSLVRKFKKEDGTWSSRRELEEVPKAPKQVILTRLDSAQWPHSIVSPADIPEWLCL